MTDYRGAADVYCGLLRKALDHLIETREGGGVTSYSRALSVLKQMSPAFGQISGTDLRSYPVTLMTLRTLDSGPLVQAIVRLSYQYASNADRSAAKIVPMSYGDAVATGTQAFDAQLVNAANTVKTQLEPWSSQAVDALISDIALSLSTEKMRTYASHASTVAALDPNAQTDACESDGDMDTPTLNLRGVNTLSGDAAIVANSVDGTAFKHADSRITYIRRGVPGGGVAAATAAFTIPIYQNASGSDEWITMRLRLNVRSRNTVVNGAAVANSTGVAAAHSVYIGYNADSAAGLNLPAAYGNAVPAYPTKFWSRMDVPALIDEGTYSTEIIVSGGLPSGKWIVLSAPVIAINGVLGTLIYNLVQVSFKKYTVGVRTTQMMVGSGVAPVPTVSLKSALWQLFEYFEATNVMIYNPIRAVLNQLRDSYVAAGFPSICSGDDSDIADAAYLVVDPAWWFTADLPAIAAAKKASYSDYYRVLQYLLPLAKMIAVERRNLLL